MCTVKVDNSQCTINPLRVSLKQQQCKQGDRHKGMTKLL